MAEKNIASQQGESLKAVAVKGVATLSVQTIMLQAIWFLTSIALLNSISITDYSVLKLVFVTIAVPSALYISGLDPIILADMGVEREKGRLGVLKGLFRAYIVFELISALVIWAGFFLCITFFQQLFSPTVQQYLLIVSFSIFIRPLQNILLQLYSLFFRFGHITRMKLYDEGLTLLAITYFVFYLKMGLSAVIVIQVVMPLVSVLLCLPNAYMLYRKELQKVRAEPSGFFGRIRAHGKWGIAAAYVSTGTDALHAYCIRFFLGPEALALYSLADSLWGHVTSLFPVKSILSVMVPQRSQDETVARNNLVRGSKYSFLGFVMLGALAAIAGYPFLYLFFPKYIQAFPVFLGLLLLIPRFSFASALGPLLRAYKFQLAGFTASLVTLLLTGILAVVLYPLFGMPGVIAEVVITNTLFIYGVYVAFIQKYPAFRIRLNELLLWDAYDTDMVKMLIDGMKRRVKSFHHV